LKWLQQLSLPLLFHAFDSPPQPMHADLPKSANVLQLLPPPPLLLPLPPKRNVERGRRC
jgi:hypothetical protein